MSRKKSDTTSRIMAKGATRIPKLRMVRPEAINSMTATRVRSSHLVLESSATTASAISETMMSRVNSAHANDANLPYSGTKFQGSIQPKMNIANVSANAIPKSRKGSFRRFIVNSSGLSPGAL